MASNMMRRHNSLPNLYKVNHYQRLPGLDRRVDRQTSRTLRRTNSTNIFDHNPEEPPPYSRERLF